MADRFYREPGSIIVDLADVLDLLEKRAQIEAPNAAAALRWTAKLAVQKWGQPATRCPRCAEPVSKMDEHLAPDDDWEWSCKAAQTPASSAVATPCRKGSSDG